MPTPKSTPPRKPNGDSGDRDPRNSAASILSRSWFWIVLAILVLFGSRFLLTRPSDNGGVIGLNRVAQEVAAGQVDKITVQGDAIAIKLRSSTELQHSRKESGESLLTTLKALGVTDA